VSDGLRLRLLGRVEMCRDGVSVTGIRSVKAQALLFYLAVTGLPHARPTLAGLLWADKPDANALTNLRQALSQLRRAVGPHLHISRHEVAFNRDRTYWLDVEAFRAVTDAAGIAQLQEAIALYQGDFLAGFYVRHAPLFEEWSLAQAAQLRAAALDALHELMEHYARRDDYGNGITYTRRLLELEPWHEEAHRGLMLLLARSGQRGAALAQYERCRQLLQDELGVEPAAETTALYHDIQTEKVQSTTPQFHPRHNLPTQTTPFIGRERELSDLGRLLAAPAARLVTILAPGGMGKTRLALAAAKIHLESTPERVCFVDLTPLTAVEDLVLAIANAASYPIQQDEGSPRQQLLDYLRPRKMLLMLDNMEQMLDGVGLVNAILQAAPGVKVLVTSRERLQLSGETIFFLDGMAVPAQEMAEDALAYDTVQLFMQGARRARSDFELVAADLRYVTRICRLVGGMPLAILLASAWVDVLSPQEIADEISRGLDLLTTHWRDLPARQRSVRAVFDHSWGRLNEADRDAFMKLSVFRGGLTREAAQTVTGASLRTLSALSDKSLLQREASGRYTLHELLRQYAADELEGTGQDRAARDAHSLYYTDFLHHREADLKGRRQVAALDEIEADFENVRVAWQWAVTRRDYETVSRALESLFWFCGMRHRYQEHQELLRLAREHLAPVAGERPHPVWGRVMARVLTVVRTYLEPLAEVRARVEAGLAIAREHGDQAEVAFCLWRLGLAIPNENDDLTEALAYCEQSLAHFQALDDLFYQAHLLDNTGLWYLRLHKPEHGTRLIQEGADLRRELGDKVGLTNSLDTLGWIAYHCGHFAKAEHCWQEAYQLAHEIKARQATILRRMAIAWLALFNRGDFATARTIAEEIQTVSFEIDYPEGKRRAQLLFGFLAGMDEDYTACRQFVGQADYRRKFTYNIAWMMMGLCLAACGLGEMQTAKQYLVQVLDMSLARKWPAVMAQCLPFAAIIKANAGDLGRAVELLALAFHHPLSPRGWLDKWPLLARFRTDSEAVLPPAVFVKAWEQGQALDLEVTVRALVEELCPDLDDQALNSDKVLVENRVNKWILKI
jgi:DNA-binding SARP family transcriptional activator/predicted ATPase